MSSSRLNFFSAAGDGALSTAWAKALPGRILIVRAKVLMTKAEARLQRANSLLAIARLHPVFSIENSITREISMFRAENRRFPVQRAFCHSEQSPPRKWGALRREIKASNQRGQRGEGAGISFGQRSVFQTGLG